MTTQASTPLFDAEATIVCAAPADHVYALVSDLAASGRWSEECRGGTWIEGAPGAIGSVFRGDNERPVDVVAWAPVVRGVWTTESEVIAAEPGRLFSWAVRMTSGIAQDSVWTYRIEPTGDGCMVRHSFRMGEATEGVRGILSRMPDEDSTRFFTDWGAKVRRDLQATLKRVRDVAEAERQEARS